MGRFLLKASSQDEDYDTCRIDRIALVKLVNDYSLTAASLDSAVHYTEDAEESSVGYKLVATDTLADTLEPGHQLALRFDKIDTSTTYDVRDFVFHSRGWYYSPPSMFRSAIDESPLEFSLEIQQVEPLSRAAYIQYSVPYSTHVKIAVYDVAGRMASCIVDEKVAPGKYSMEWKGRDDVNRTLASGVYFVKMLTKDFEKTTKMVIME